MHDLKVDEETTSSMIDDEDEDLENVSLLFSTKLVHVIAQQVY